MIPEYLLWLIAFQGIVILFGIYAIMKRMTVLWDIHIEQETRFQDWLFRSLYTINQGVLLPDVAPQEIKREKATVYNPEDDPMREFKEGLDDYFGDKK